MKGLKLNITLTVFLLLSTTTLLTAGIMLIFWQHSLAANVTAQKTAELAAIADLSGDNAELAKTYLQRLARQSDDVCTALLLDERLETQPESSCRQADQLRRTVARSFSSGKAVSLRSPNSFGSLLAGNVLLHVAVPLAGKGHPAGAVGVTFTLPSVFETMRHNQQIILIYLLFNIVVLTVIGFFRTAALAIRPIDRLIEKTSSYSGEQDFGLVAEGEGSEFRHLSYAINRMVSTIDSDRIRLQDTVRSLQEANETIHRTQLEMVRTEKLASVGRLSAGLAHEIGNPLGIVLGYLGLLRQEKISLADKLEYIQRAEQELNRINSLVRQLLDFSRPLPAGRDRVAVHDLILDLQQMLLAQKQHRDVTFSNDLQASNSSIFGNREALRQAFLNFYLNGLDAVHDKAPQDEGAIFTATCQAKRPTGETLLQVTITDNGTGIPPEHLKNIFDPFFTTKEPGKGTGLGLSVAHTIIDNTGGTLRAESTEGLGTSIIVELPVASEQTGEEP